MRAQRSEPPAPFGKGGADSIRVSEIREVDSPHAATSSSNLGDVTGYRYRGDVGPSGVEPAKWPGTHVDPVYRNPDGTSPLNGGSDATVKQAERQRDDRGQDCRAREVVCQMPAFSDLREQYAGGPDVDPVDTVRMAMLRRPTPPGRPDPSREREDEHGARDDFDDGQREPAPLHPFRKRLHARHQQTGRRNRMIDLWQQLGAFEPARLQENHD